MPKVNFVKSARKHIDSIGVKPGDSYYWWKMKTQRGGIVRQSKSYPKPSQLTMSPYKSGALAIGEDLEAALDAAEEMQEVRDAVQAAIDTATELREEAESSLDNMPEGLRDGDTGTLLQERIEALENYVSELEGLDLDEEFEESSEYDEDSSAEEQEEAKATWLDGKKDEVRGIELDVI